MLGDERAVLAAEGLEPERGRLLEDDFDRVVVDSLDPVDVTIGPIVTAAVAGSAAYSQLNTTSSAVNGLPSCQVTPFLRFQTTHFPSRPSPPLSTLGMSAASTAARFPSGS